MNYREDGYGTVPCPETGILLTAAMAAAPELLAKDPDVRPVDVIAVE